MDVVYSVILSVSFLCFLYHTTVHVLEHYRNFKVTEIMHELIEISMFVGWFLYFAASFYSFPDIYTLSYMNYAGFVMLVAGFYIFLRSHSVIHRRIHKGRGDLITEGIYKHVRHPMYLGSILLFIGAPLLGNSFVTFGLSPLFIIQILIWRYMEEKELVQEFGNKYVEYRRKTWF